MNRRELAADWQQVCQTMPEQLYLPRLNRLTPTLDSTLLKIMEEAGELARAVLHFLPYEAPDAWQEAAGHPAVQALLAEVSGELLDVAQTCVTMLFVMEEDCGVAVDTFIGSHLDKLAAKGYAFDRSRSYSMRTADGFKYLQLPRLCLPEVTLLTTVCKIQEEIGELTQFLGKRAGASGETAVLPPAEVLNGCAAELLDVAQCCFTMMYILASRYGVDVTALMETHIAKLRQRGYFV